MLTIVLATVWLLLVNEISAGYAVLGLLIGLSVPLDHQHATGRTGRLPSKPLLVIEYILIVLWDIVVSNITVARLILFRRWRQLAVALRDGAAGPDICGGHRRSIGHDYDDAGNGQRGPFVGWYEASGPLPGSRRPGRRGR